MKPLRSLLFSVASVLSVASVFPLYAQQYPTRPIKIIVPFGPGGFTDVAARILQKELAPAIGQPVDFRLLTVRLST